MALAYDELKKFTSTNTEHVATIPRAVVKELNMLDFALTRKKIQGLDESLVKDIGQSAFNLLSLLGRSFPSSAEPIREALASVLAFTYTHETVPIFVSYLSTKLSTPTSVRSVVLCSIAKLNDPQTFVPDVIPVALKVLKSSDLVARVQAVKNIGLICQRSGLHPDMMKIVSKASVDKASEVRFASAELFCIVLEKSSARIPHLVENGIQIMIKTLTSERSLQVVSQASHAIGQALAFILLNDTTAEERSDEHTPADTNTKGFKMPTIARKKATTITLKSISAAVLHVQSISMKMLNSNCSQNTFGCISIILSSFCASVLEENDDKLFELVQGVLSIVDEFSLATPTEYVRARNAIGFALRKGIGERLSEFKQKELLEKLLKCCAGEKNHHKLTLLLLESAHLIAAVGEASTVLYDDLQSIMKQLVCHEKHSSRFAAASVLTAMHAVLPSRNVLQLCLSELKLAREMLIENPTDRGSMYGLSGWSTSISNILRSSTNEVSCAEMNNLLNECFTLLQSTDSSNSAGVVMTCARAGWCILGGLFLLKSVDWMRKNITKIFPLFVDHCEVKDGGNSNISQEIVRLEACVVAFRAFITTCDALVAENHGIRVQSVQILHRLLTTPIVCTKPRVNASYQRILGWIQDCFCNIPASSYLDSLSPLMDIMAQTIAGVPLGSSYKEELRVDEANYLSENLSRDTNVLEVKSLSRIASHSPDSLFTDQQNAFLILSQGKALSDMEVEAQSISKHSTVDSAIHLFGHTFTQFPTEMQQRCLHHFTTGIAFDFATTSYNVCSALLSAAKGCQSQHSMPLTMMHSILFELLGNSNQTVRRGSAEAIRLLMHAYSLTKWNNEIAAALSSSNDYLRTGGILASQQNTNFIYRSAAEMTYPIHTSGLCAWKLVLENKMSSGEFEQLVKSTIQLVEAHVFVGLSYSAIHGSEWQVSVDICLGQLVNTVLSALGPELRLDLNRLEDFHVIWHILASRNPHEARLQVEYWKYIETLILFAPGQLPSKNIIQELKDLLLDRSTPVALSRVLVSCFQLWLQATPDAYDASVDEVLVVALENVFSAHQFEESGYFLGFSSRMDKSSILNELKSILVHLDKTKSVEFYKTIIADPTARSQLKSIALQCIISVMDTIDIDLADFVSMACQCSMALVDGYPLETLQTSGLECMTRLVSRFKAVRDPIDPSVPVLQQYQAQLSCALRQNCPKSFALRCELIATLICEKCLTDVAGNDRLIKLVVGTSSVELNQVGHIARLYGFDQSLIDANQFSKYWMYLVSDYVHLNKEKQKLYFQGEKQAYERFAPFTLLAIASTDDHSTKDKIFPICLSYLKSQGYNLSVAKALVRLTDTTAKEELAVQVLLLLLSTHPDMILQHLLELVKSNESSTVPIELYLQPVVKYLIQAASEDWKLLHDPLKLVHLALLRLEMNSTRTFTSLHIEIICRLAESKAPVSTQLLGPAVLNLKTCLEKCGNQVGNLSPCISRLMSVDASDHAKIKVLAQVVAQVLNRVGSPVPIFITAQRVLKSPMLYLDILSYLQTLGSMHLVKSYALSIVSILSAKQDTALPLLRLYGLLLPMMEVAYHLNFLNCVLPLLVQIITTQQGTEEYSASTILLLQFAQQSPMALKQVVSTCREKNELQLALQQAVAASTRTTGDEKQKTLDLSRYN